MFNFDINKPPKKVYFIVYYCEKICDRGVNGDFYDFLDFACRTKIEDFILHSAITENDCDNIARIVKVFSTSKEARKYIAEMSEICKTDYETYVKMILQERKDLAEKTKFYIKYKR